MIITKEQQDALIRNYIKSGRTMDECVGFIDGIEQVMELIDKLENNLENNKEDKQ